MTAVRLGGALTIVGLVAFWGTMWWRGRHEPAPGTTGVRGRGPTS
jgi:hypothetical protein